VDCDVSDARQDLLSNVKTSVSELRLDFPGQKIATLLGFSVLRINPGILTHSCNCNVSSGQEYEQSSTLLINSKI